MVTTNLFSHPVFKDGGVHEQRPLGAPLRAPQGHAQPRPRRRARCADVRVLGRPRGRRDRRGEGRSGRARSLPRGPRHCWRSTSIDRGYGIRFALEPKPNEPRGDILLPTIGHALAFIATLEHPEMVGVNPEVGHEQMAGLNFVHGIAQALWQGKLFHIDLNGQRGVEVRPGPGLRSRRPDRARSSSSTCWRRRRRRRAPYDGPRHFDYKPLRTEDIDGVWASAAANMRTYLLLKERAAAFRADPEVQAGARREQGPRARAADAGRR